MAVDDDHAAIWAHEFAACRPDVWERWVDEVETLLGRSPDGDQDRDGFSLDGFYAQWEERLSPAAAIAVVVHPRR